MRNRGFFMVMLVPILALLGLSAPAIGGGLTVAGNQLWSQESPGILDTAESNDLFGKSLVEGDFNGDGYADLAVGVPDEDVGSVTNAGVVNILYGSPSGLSSTGNQIWHQNSPGILGGAEEEDYFGWALAAGDFNGDGYADLAVGVPFEDIGSVTNAGAVNILYGSSSGLSATGNQLWYQGKDGVPGGNDENDFFGYALAAGDFDALDGYADLAVGVLYEDVRYVEDAGVVNVLYGSSSGLSGYVQVWHKDSPDILGNAKTDDLFGYSLAAGDFNGDSVTDLAVGVPRNHGRGISREGAVSILYGSKYIGLTATGNQLWSQDSRGIAGVGEHMDYFGGALAVGDFNRDGYVDLAVGVRGEDIGTIDNAGAVNVIYGSVGGLTATGNQIWHQDSMGIAGKAEEEDYFGWALAAGDFNGDGYADLAVGVIYEDIGTADNAGAVNVMYGSAGGLTTTGNQIWYQGKDALLETCEGSDLFGAAVAAGDFNGNGCADLAIGAEGEDLNSIENAGVVNVLYGYPDAMPWLMLLLDN